MGCNNSGSSCVRSDRGQAWTPRRDFAVSKSLAQPITIGCVTFEKAGATPNHDPARASAARSNRSECTTSGGGQVQARAPPGAGARCQRMLAHIRSGTSSRPGPRACARSSVNASAGSCLPTAVTGPADGPAQARTAGQRVRSAPPLVATSPPPTMIRTSRHSAFGASEAATARRRAPAPGGAPART